MRIKREAITLIVGFGLTLCAGAVGETRADSTAPASPYRTPDFVTPDGLPAIGYRYANLGDVERRSLRQSFKLPMEALAVANSTSDLLSAAIVQPLPNPDQPFLPVSSTNAGGDPFAGDNTQDGDVTRKALGALGRLFAKEEALRGNDVSGSSSSDYPPSTTSPVAASSGPLESEDPFADASASSESESAEETDPFGSDDEGDFDDDPFGDF